MFHHHGSTSGSSANNTYVCIQSAAKMPRHAAEQESNTIPPVSMPKVVEEDSLRERLMRHRSEMAGRVWIPDIWGQESFLKEWVDCSAFDSSMVPNGVDSAREALVQECRRTNSPGLMRIRNRC